MSDERHQQSSSWKEPYTRNGESAVESRWRDLRERLDDMRRDLRERIDDVKGTMNTRLGELDKEIGRLQAGKADREFVENIDKHKASKLVETIVYSLVGLILTAFITALVAMVWANKP